MRFCKHLRLTEMSYFKHMFVAFYYYFHLKLACTALLIHAVFPFLFTSTASRIVTKVYSQFIQFKRRHNVHTFAGNRSLFERDLQAMLDISLYLKSIMDDDEKAAWSRLHNYYINGSIYRAY